MRRPRSEASEHPRRVRWPIVAGVLALLAAIAIAATRIDVLQGDPYGQDRTSVTGEAAPELRGITAWFNSEPFTLASKRGSVVWLDVWTYSCINCIRTLPFVQAMHERYAAAGLTVLGLHSPEFEFEREPGNVRAAIERFGVTYPVALDAQMETWTAYGNRYWPRVYLIGADGTIRYDHIGEGGDVALETQVRTLLAETGATLPEPLAMDVEAPSAGITPELYAGSLRGGPSNAPSGTGFAPNYQLADDDPAPDTFALEGSWIVEDEFIEAATEGARLVLDATARNIFIVAASGTGDPIGARIRIDDADAPSGIDVGAAGVLRFDDERLYTLLESDAVAQHRVELIVGVGTRIYAFTFG